MSRDQRVQGRHLTCPINWMSVFLDVGPVEIWISHSVLHIQV